MKRAVETLGAAAERVFRSGHRAFVGLLLALFVLAGYNSLVRESATFDETAHLPAGYTYLDTGDFRLNAEHPPLAKAWAALPVWLTGRLAPDYDSSAWRGRPRTPPHAPGTSLSGDSGRSKASEWLFGYEALNGPLSDASRRDPQRALIPARSAMLVLGLCLAWIVYSWSRRLWGRGAALFSLFCFCLSPTMLAHTRLVTTDLPSALGFTAVLYGFWLYASRPGVLRGLAFAAAVAATLLTKFSALLLVVIVPVNAVLWIAGATNGQARMKRTRQAVWAGAAAALVGVAGLWIGYGMRFAAAADPAYHLDWSIIGLESGRAAEMVQFALRAKLLPEAYLYGLAYVLGGAARRLAYLNGTQSIVGFWYYFPEAFLLKTPPSTLLLAGWLAVQSAWGHRLGSFKGLYLALPVAIYLGVSMMSNLNIGHRHLTAVYPLLFVLLGGLVPLVSKTNLGRATLAALIAGSVLSFAAATPGYLSYFNLLAGGPRGGPRYLLDSNVDWGQDLPRLKRFMDREGLDSLYLAYFGTADPAAYGIDYHKVYRVHDFDPNVPSRTPGPGDYLAVSVNLLYGLYFDDDRDVAEALAGRGWVKRESVRQWLDERTLSHESGRDFPGLGSWLVDRGALDPGQLQLVTAGLTSSRLRTLRETTIPVHHAGDSIAVYRIPASGF